jgi:hypothetical protein
MEAEQITALTESIRLKGLVEDIVLFEGKISTVALVKKLAGGPAYFLAIGSSLAEVGIYLGHRSRRGNFSCRPCVWECPSRTAAESNALSILVTS